MEELKTIQNQAFESINKQLLTTGVFRLIHLSANFLTYKQKFVQRFIKTYLLVIVLTVLIRISILQQFNRGVVHSLQFY